MVKVAIWLLACVVSAILYRAGGMSKDADAKPTWIPMWIRNSWCRDWLCPACVYGSLLLFWQPSSSLGWILLLICYPLLGGALSTYWDFVFKFDNYWFSGFMCGVAAFPLIFCGIAWWLILVRAIFLALSWGLWSKYQDVDYIEEFGRGFFLVI